MKIINTVILVDTATQTNGVFTQNIADYQKMKELVIQHNGDFLTQDPDDQMQEVIFTSMTNALAFQVDLLNWTRKGAITCSQ